MKRVYIKFTLLIAFALLCGGVVFPNAVKDLGGFAKTKLKMQKVGESITKTGSYFESKYPFKLGLDLQGGSHLIYQIKNDNLKAEDKPKAVESLHSVIRNRIDQFGVAEPNIYTTRRAGQDFLVVELPGVKDLTKALDLIGKTAKLEFKIENPEKPGEYMPNDPPLTGEHLQHASVVFDQNSGLPQVSIEFDEAGGKIFADMTRNNLNKTIAIYLDDQLVSAPNVQSEIADGRGVITGVGTVEEAKSLAIQLNAGALPVPIELVENRTVGATLGQDSIRRSIAAGILGVLAVILFMIIYYRLPGILASLALIIYTILSLALFKGIFGFILPFTPVTLTLAGIAGFILSIGMAVDANVLIFERMKEELRAGKSFSLALDAGFKRAWNSIRDSNVSSLITCLILYVFGTGLIRGFAITLALGILVSMFTAINVTRSFLDIVTRFKWGRHPWLYGVRVPKKDKEVSK